MALIPESEQILEEGMEITLYPSRMYYMDLENKRIRGMVEDLESMKQVVYCILMTERSEYDAYSDNYGVELMDLFGMPLTYVIPELERRITEALTWDSRIDSVDDFEFTTDHSKVTATFTVHTIFGDIDSERTVEI